MKINFQAQEFSKLLPDLERDQKVILKMKYANMIQVESWDKDELLVEAEVNINDGKQNHAHKMRHTVDNRIVTIIADLDKGILSSSHVADCYEPLLRIMRLMTARRLKSIDFPLTSNTSCICLLMVTWSWKP